MWLVVWRKLSVCVIITAATNLLLWALYLPAFNSCLRTGFYLPIFSKCLNTVSINFYNVDYICGGVHFIGCGKPNIDKQKPMQAPSVSFQITGQLNELLQSPMLKLKRCPLQMNWMGAFSSSLCAFYSYVKINRLSITCSISIWDAFFNLDFQLDTVIQL